MEKTYRMYFESNEGVKFQAVTGLTHEKALELAESEAAFSIGPLQGKYVIEEE